MEGDAGLQLERVSQAVFADGVVAGERLLDAARVGQLEKRFVDVAVEGLVDALPGAGGVVEVLRFVERAYLDGCIRVGSVLRIDVRRRGHRQDAEQCGRGDGQDR